VTAAAKKLSSQIQKLQSKLPTNGDDSSTRGRYSPAHDSYNHPTYRVGEYRPRRNQSNPDRSQRNQDRRQSDQSQHHRLSDYPPPHPSPPCEGAPLLTVNNTRSQRRVSQEEDAPTEKAEEIDLNDVLDRMGLNDAIMSRISSVFFFMLLPFIGQWMFWVGFVGLYADR